MARGLAPIIDFIFPPRCPACGDALVTQDGLCAACWGSLVIPGEPCCQSCRRPLTGSSSEVAEPMLICAPCLANPPRHNGIFAATLYNQASRQLVLSLKHGRRIALAGLLGRMIHARLPTLGSEWRVVPVPLHRWRLWSRGFNQSALLARDIAQRSGTQLLVDALVRTRATPVLRAMGRTARARTLAGAIQLNARQQARVQGARIVLVDDVMTSGATTDACVRALKRAGASEVIIACFARVLDEALPTQ